MGNPKYEKMSTLVAAIVEKDGLEAAIKQLSDGIVKKPDFLEAYLVRGELHLKMGDSQKALNDFEKAIKINPNEPESYLLRGSLYVKLNDDTDKAIHDYEKFLELDPNNKKTELIRGTIKKLRGIDETNNKSHLANSETDIVIDDTPQQKSNIGFITRFKNIFDAIFDGFDGGNIEDVKYFIEQKGTDVDVIHEELNFTPLLYAALYGKVDIAKYLVENGANVNFKGGPTGDASPLIYAIDLPDNQRMERIKLIKFLISKGANVNEIGSRDWRPLHFAVQTGDVEIVKYLLENGADISSRTNRGNTPAAMARQMEKYEVIEYFNNISSTTSGGCYIATAVYHSYNAPEVLCLRQFRDETLSASILGRIFIRLYYLFSPPIAKWLKKTQCINMFVRKILNNFVVRLNKNSHNQNNAAK